jgi:quinol monooxygenase YgiN
MEFEPGARDEAAGVLRSLIGPVRAESGCAMTQLLGDTNHEGTLAWVEEWRSMEDFERHLRTPAFRRIIAVIESAAAPPVVEIDGVAWRRGFDLIEEILGRTPEAVPRGGAA